MPFRARSSPSWTGRRGPVVRNGGVRRAAAVTAARNRPSPAAAANVRTAGFVGIENKFVDYNVATDTFVTGWSGGELDPGTVDTLTGVSQGTGESQRDGRVYHIKSIHIKGWVELSSTESVTSPLNEPLIRLILVWDTQTNAVQLNAEDVMLVIGASEDVNSFRNLQYSHRFIVLKDKLFKLNTSNQTNEGAINLFASGTVRAPIRWNKTFKKPIKVRCKGTTANVTDITDNSFHLIGTSTTATKITYQSRMRFTG